MVVAGASKQGGALCPVDGGGMGGNECRPTLDFETDAAGGALHAGDLVSEQWASLGIHFASGNSRTPLMIFDSAHPTGGDTDLGAPNRDFGGPGVGSGGSAGRPGENSLPQGKVLILSEDKDSNDPDDNAGGGTIIATFDEPLRVDSIALLDIEESGGTVKAYDANGGLVISVVIPPVGNNGYQVLPIGATGVSRLEVKMTGSGALADLTFCADDTEPPPPPPPTAPGTGTIGYWKNHPEAWPADTIVIGGQTYNRDAAIDLMKTKARGDKTYNLFKQLVAAVLNVQVGNVSECVDDTVMVAQAWMAANPVASGVRARDDAWQNEGGSLHDTLDAYNNGLLCAPHRD
jgi:hypothetical protein